MLTVAYLQGWLSNVDARVDSDRQLATSLASTGRNHRSSLYAVRRLHCTQLGYIRLLMGHLCCPHRLPSVSCPLWTRRLLGPRYRCRRTYSLFTPPTPTRQDCLVVSVSAVWTQFKTRQDSFFLSRPSFQFPSFRKSWKRLNSCKLNTGSRQDKTVMSCHQLCSHRRNGQDKTRQFCLVRVGGVNKLLGLPGFFLSSSSFCQLPSELAERNSTKSGHLLGSECGLKMCVWNLRYLFPLQNGGAQTIF